MHKFQSKVTAGHRTESCAYAGAHFMSIQIQIILFLLIGILPACSNNLISEKNKSIDKKFTAWWADTYWEFYFKKDGSFKRISMGHYGNTEVHGNYEMVLDTIHIISGFKNTNGTVNEYYLIDKDSFLIDLELLYDYKSQERIDTSSFVNLPVELGKNILV